MHRQSPYIPTCKILLRRFRLRLRRLRSVGYHHSYRNSIRTRTNLALQMTDKFDEDTQTSYFLSLLLGEAQ